MTSVEGIRGHESVGEAGQFNAQSPFHVLLAQVGLGALMGQTQHTLGSREREEQSSCGPTRTRVSVVDGAPGLSRLSSNFIASLRLERPQGFSSFHRWGEQGTLGSLSPVSALQALRSASVLFTAPSLELLLASLRPSSSAVPPKLYMFRPITQVLAFSTHLRWPFISVA